jgi:hypothetical protein
MRMYRLTSGLWPANLVWALQLRQEEPPPDLRGSDEATTLSRPP